MTTLSLNSVGELCLTLRGEAENPILATLRHWPYWQSVTLERDPNDEQRYLAVTLVTDVAHEPTIREILKRSFNLTLPAIGTQSELVASNPEPRVRTRRTS